MNSVKDQKKILIPTELKELSNFVVKENYKHHFNNFLEDYKDDVELVLEEEASYKSDIMFFVYKNRLEEILGSIRILKWNGLDILPIQKLFQIDPLMITSTNNIWHIGRFAIKKGINDVNLFKKLMICAIIPICENKESIAFAECDDKLLKVLVLLGIKVKVIGEAIHYLGSKTVPISISYYGLIDFYNENKNLITEDDFTSRYYTRNKKHSFCVI